MPLRDPISSASHLLTALWAAYATLILLRLAGPGRRWPIAIFGLSMVLLYTASGTFHGVPYPMAEFPHEYRFFQKIDQSAIYLLIAGTNTPCLALLLGGRRAKWFLAVMWAMAFTGIACLWFLPKVPHEVMIALYIGIGWFGILPVPAYYTKVGWRTMNWMWLGAAFYSSGAVFELAEWPLISTAPVRFGHHELMHLCDTAGSMCFVAFVSRWVAMPAADRVHCPV